MAQVNEEVAPITFMPDEVDVIIDLIHDHGFEYSLDTDNEALKELARKIKRNGYAVKDDACE